MIKFLKIFLFIAVIFVFFYDIGFSQEDWWKDKKFKDVKSKMKYDDCKKAFIDIAAGLNYSNINSIRRYFSDQVYLNIISIEKGYYSSSQAEIILDDFINYFKVVNFKLKRSYYKNSFAFALGKYKYNYGEGVQELEVSVSLIYDDGTWYIDQITVN
jgi:hypothetical protein